MVINRQYLSFIILSAGGENLFLVLDSHQRDSAVMNSDQVILYTLNNSSDTNLLIIYGIQDVNRLVQTMNLSGLQLNSIKAAEFLFGIPSWLNHLGSLKSLYLDHNELEEIPEGIFPLLKDTLASLCLHNNALQTIPDDICELSRLVELRLDCNDLRCLPDSMGACCSPEVLHMPHNPRLQVLPDSIGQLSRLHHILLDGTSVKSLPTTMANCVCLAFLTADEGILTDPPSEVWQGMDGSAIRQYLSSRGT